MYGAFAILLISSGERAEWLPNFDDPSQFSMDFIVEPLLRHEWTFLSAPPTMDTMEGLFHSVIEEPQLANRYSLIQWYNQICENHKISTAPDIQFSITAIQKAPFYKKVFANSKLFFEKDFLKVYITSDFLTREVIFGTVRRQEMVVNAFLSRSLLAGGIYSKSPYQFEIDCFPETWVKKYMHEASLVVSALFDSYTLWTKNFDLVNPTLFLQTVVLVNIKETENEVKQQLRQKEHDEKLQNLKTGIFNEDDIEQIELFLQQEFTVIPDKYMPWNNNYYNEVLSHLDSHLLDFANMVYDGYILADCFEEQEENEFLETKEIYGFDEIKELDIVSNNLDGQIVNNDK